MTTCMILAIFGLLFGLYLILEGIFYKEFPCQTSPKEF